MKVNSIKTNEKFVSNLNQNSSNKSFKGLMVLEDVSGAIKVAITNHGKEADAIGYVCAYGENIPLGNSVWVKQLTTMLSDFQIGSIDFIERIRQTILTKIINDPSANLLSLGDDKLALITKTVAEGKHKYSSSSFSKVKNELIFSQSA